MELAIRLEGREDQASIRAVHQAAFGREAEAELVDSVRADRATALSLVAVWRAAVVGHALFTPVSIDGSAHAVALGPIAVDPDHQRQGIGSALVREGLVRLATLGHGAVVVLGEPGFYRRFGFVPARAFGVSWDRSVPDEVFMALEIRPRALAGGGSAQYLPLFESMKID